MMKKIYPRTGDTQTVYLNAVVKDPSIEVGDYTIYNDFVSNPLLFEQNNVLYHYPINHERLIIGKFCFIADYFTLYHHTSGVEPAEPIPASAGSFQLGKHGTPPIQEAYDADYRP